MSQHLGTSGILVLSDIGGRDSLVAYNPSGVQVTALTACVCMQCMNMA